MSNITKHREKPYWQMSDEEIMMIVPNNVTFGQYSLSEWQENVLTLIGDQLQKHITRQQELPRDLFNQPYVEIYCDEAAGRNNKSKIKEEILDLCKKQFAFRWVHPEIHKTIETTGTIITTIHDVKGTNRLAINFNVWAIPFLIYYGVGVGGTRYNKCIALSLRGNYTKRLYKIICSQQDRGNYFYSIDQFREDMRLPAKYTNNEIERAILIPARDRIKESGSEVWFEYEMICKYPKKGRKPKSDTIVFKIKTLHPKETGGERYNQYYYVYRFIQRAMEYPTTNIAMLATDKITEMGRLRDVYERCVYYEEQEATKQKSSAHVLNSLLKMLREEFDIKPPEKEKQEMIDKKKKKERPKTAKNTENKTASSIKDIMLNFANS